MSGVRFRLAPVLLALAAPASAGMEDFHAGTVITEFGKVATIDSDMALTDDAAWKHAFDVAPGKKGELNRGIESAARFINMMAEAGVTGERLKIAVVVHGPAVFDVSSTTRYASKYDGADNPNAALVAALVEAGVEIWVCGQSATAHDVSKTDLLPGVKMALSAITAHAELQRQGYSLNPF